MVLSIELHETDAYLLRSFLHCIGASQHEAKPTRDRSVRVTINSTELCQDLIRLGIKPRKSFTGSFAVVPENLASQYIRGLFDGDGCITHKLKRGTLTPRTSIVGGKEFCLWAFSSIKQGAGITAGGVYPTSTIYGVEFSGFKQNARLYEWIYTGASFYMKRKKDRFEELFTRKYAESQDDRRFLLPKIA